MKKIIRGANLRQGESTLEEVTQNIIYTSKGMCGEVNWYCLLNCACKKEKGTIIQSLLYRQVYYT